MFCFRCRIRRALTNCLPYLGEYILSNIGKQWFVCRNSHGHTDSDEGTEDFGRIERHVLNAGEDPDEN